MGNDKKRLTKIEKESKAKEEQRKAEIVAIPPSLSNALGYGGNWYPLPTPAANTPDWREWIITPKVEVWKACALSLNIDPHSLKRRDEYVDESDGSPYFRDSSFPSKAIREECNLRRRVLIANLRDDPKKFSLRSSTASGYSEVRLSEFAAWALSIGWDMPAELVAIARKHDEQDDAPAALATVSPGETATSPDLPPSPCTKREILAADWPLPNNVNLEKLLSDVPKWLEQARVKRGAPGRGSSLWNPAQLAICLNTRRSVKVAALDIVIRGSFPAFHSEWENAKALL